MSEYIYECQNCKGRIIFGIPDLRLQRYINEGKTREQALNEEKRLLEEAWKLHPQKEKIAFLVHAPSKCPHCSWEPPNEQYFQLDSLLGEIKFEVKK